MLKGINWTAVAIVTALLASCSSEPVIHEPVTDIGPTGDDQNTQLAGEVEDLGHCEVLNADDAPDGFDRVSLNLSSHDTVREWMTLATEAGFQALQSDPWGSWLALGDIDAVTELGVVLIGRRTGSVDICGEERIPRFDISEMVALYDLDDSESFPTPVEIYFGGDPFDPEDEAVATVLEAGLAALQGQTRDLTIRVDGTLGDDCPCPTWRLERPDVGYIELAFSDPSIALTEERVLAELLADEGAFSLEELSQDDREDIMEEVAEITRGREYRFTGHFTGEVLFDLDDNTATAAPVFMVTGIPED